MKVVKMNLADGNTQDRTWVAVVVDEDVTSGLRCCRRFRALHVACGLGCCMLKED